MEKIQIVLNSKTANQYLNNKTTDCIFILPKIDVKRRHKAYISVIDASIPYSFYNVNSTNNTLNYTLNSIPYSLTITKANYNIRTLISFLQSNLEPGFTITYNSSTNKLQFTHSTYDFSFSNTSTCFELLGFEDNITYYSDSLTLLSTIGINLFTVRNVLIASSNFVLNNINSATPNKASIITSVPVDVNAGSIINYKNINNIKSLVHDIHNINTLHVQLLDQDADVLELNGLHWSLNLLLTIE